MAIQLLFRSFANCEELKEIILPANLEHIGGAAFYFCRKLSLVKIPESVTRIGDEAFFCCNRLYSITIPEKTTIIGDKAFYSSGLTTANIKSNLAYLGHNAFSHCRQLKNFYYYGDSNPKNYGRKIFKNCPKLNRVTVPQNYKNYFFCWGLIKRAYI